MTRTLIITLCLLFSLCNFTLTAQTDDLKSKQKKETKKEQKSKQDDSVKVEDVPEELAEVFKGGAKKWKKKGDQLSAKGANYAAIENYEIALNKAKKKGLRKSLFYKCGESAYAVRDYVKAETFYKSSLAISTKKNKLPLLNYQFGNSLKYQAKYEKATKAYKIFITEIGDNTKFSNEKSKARLEVKGCDYALNLSPTELKYTVENAGDEVNGEFADFGPDIRGDELVFSKILNSYEEGKDKETHLAKIYTSEMYDEKFNFAQKFSSTLNQGEEFVCNPSFSSDKNTVYFTKCMMANNIQATCKIYASNLKNGVWSEPVLLDGNINTNESSSSHPQVVLDDKGNEVLYFSSNRDGGRGGKDIWVSTKKENGSFTKAKNLGSKINSRFDEISPFYVSETRSLYFSTDGKISLGGFDVYVSTNTADGWSDALMLPAPINSSVDDYDFIMDKSSEFGFFVSNRIGTISSKSPTCCDDIFLWRTTNIDIYLKGLVYAENSTSRELMKNADIRLVKLNEDSERAFSFEGKEFVVELEKDADYELLAEAEGFKPAELRFNTNGIVRSDTLQYDLFFKERMSFNQKVIGTIYYEYNQSRLTKEAPKTLKEIVIFLKTYPNTTVEISAHTDNKGAASYNLNLSQERCLAAANYLDFQGISNDRIVLKWYGETQPIAPNSNKDGSDNPEGRLLNRRTEFKIVE